MFSLYSRLDAFVHTPPPEQNAPLAICKGDAGVGVPIPTNPSCRIVTT